MYKAQQKDLYCMQFIGLVLVLLVKECKGEE